jgi:hypothetical protein
MIGGYVFRKQRKDPHIMSLKISDIKDWLLYVEDDKMKAFDVTKHDNDSELIQLCRSTPGISMFGFVSFEHEKDATHYGDMFR